MNSLLKRILGIIVNDFPAKVFILGLSVFLWYFVNVLAVEVINLSLPVKVENPPEGAAVVPLDKLNVQVHLRSRLDISGQTNQIRAYVDLAKAGYGEGFFPIKLEGVPEGVFSSVLPYSMRIDVDRFAEKELPIVLNAVGGDEKNHVLDYRWMPSTIKVRAPVRVFNRLREIESESLDIRKINAPQVTLPLKLKIPPLSTLFQTNALVTLSLAIERYTNVVEVPLVLSNLPKDLSVDSLPIVRAEVVSRTSNAQVLKERLSAVADASNVMEGEYILPITLSSTDEIISNRTPFAKLKISKENL